MKHPAEETFPDPPVAALQGVSLHYGDGPAVLHEVTTTLPAGAFRFLTGPSGAGKTSLLSLLFLGQRHSRGRLDLFGEDVNAASRGTLARLRRRIGTVFQDFRLLDHLSAFDNVALPLKLTGSVRDVPSADVADLLDWVGLGDHLNDPVATLSGGQKQRVAIARAVITRPQLILADEPTGNVDDEIGNRILRLFVELNRMGAAVVIATHNRRLVEAFGYPEWTLADGLLSEHFPNGEGGRADARQVDAGEGAL